MHLSVSSLFIATEEQEKMFGQCSWKAAVAMNNEETDKCIRSMMKEEGEAGMEMGVACKKEIAECYVDGEVDSECLGGKVMQNAACMKALMAMEDESSDGDSSGSGDMSESKDSMDAVTFDVEVYMFKAKKGMKDCQGKSWQKKTVDVGGKKKNKGEPIDNFTVTMGCTFQEEEEDEKKSHYEMIECSDKMDGSVVITQYASDDPDCSGEPIKDSEMPVPGTPWCGEDKENKVIFGYLMDKVPQCMKPVPAAWKMYDETAAGLAEVCKSSEEMCTETCGLKYSNKAGCRVSEKTKFKCKAFSKETCEMVKNGCKVNPKGNCSGKFGKKK